IMKMEEKLLKFIIKAIKKEGREYIEALRAEIPEINGEIPRLDFNEALNILKEVYNKNDLEGDLDPEAEKLLYKYSKEKLNSEFLFLTNYPRKKRPMYTMPNGEYGTHSFDLLFRGIEITTGGQR
ncbi:aspartate--tRNA(Asn) ligase, partial [Clostridium saudiense]|nr:aspartate--tRNA(Asn) ligase [Clostridium saudiense]